jgi:hypothetical protein
LDLEFSGPELELLQEGLMIHGECLALVSTLSSGQFISQGKDSNSKGTCFQEAMLHPFTNNQASLQ